MPTVNPSLLPTMAIDVRQAAKHLCKESSWSLTNLQVQKILYICHVVYYGQNKKLLIRGEFQAWDYGPVHPDLYHFLKKYGADPIPEHAFNKIEDLKYSKHEKELKLISDGSETFGAESGPKLVAMTHWDKGAWADKYRRGIRYIPILEEDILKEYKAYEKVVRESINTRS